VSWSSRFAEPIPLPDGRELVTLRDAAHYITVARHGSDPNRYVLL
jgi:hypothetical protein